MTLRSAKGDFPKWIHSNINFVFGVDLSRDNIENKIDGVCARYLNYRKKYNKLPEVMFLHGDSSKQLFNGDGYFDERSLKIQNALLGKGDKDAVELGKGVFDLYGKCSKLFDVSSIQFALHYMFESQETLHNFIKNVCDFTRVGGHFIGTCFNGHRVFDFISQLGENEERSIYKNDTKIFGIKKRFSSSDFPNNANSLGYEILIYQETINQYISEYLVNFKYFIEVMEDYGFVPIQNPFIKQKKTSLGGFKELYDRCLYNHDMRDISNLGEEEKQISFMNEYFVFQKLGMYLLARFVRCISRNLKKVQKSRPKHSVYMCKCDFRNQRINYKYVSKISIEYDLKLRILFLLQWMTLKCLKFRQTHKTILMTKTMMML